MTEALTSARPRREATTGERLLTTLADLRLTVALFALAIFLVFAGTLAQVDHDVWYVVEEGYFRVWFARIEFQAFVRLVEMFTSGEAQPVAGGFWFPGGKTIGWLMFANLLAAHAIRFKATAKGRRMTLGLGVLGAGVAATVAVLLAGMDQSLKGQLSTGFCDNLWQAIRAALAGGGLWAAYWVAQRKASLRPPEWWLAAIGAGGWLAVVGYLFAYPSVRPDDAGMRIVWELTKGGVAAALSLWGCWLVFNKRAGIVLLHAGVGLLMVNELATDYLQQEGRMTIPEGGTVNYVEDIRSAELAITTDDGDATRVTVVPASRLAWAADSESTISDPQLPFDLRVVRYEKNSALVKPTEGLENPATAGAGLVRVAVEQRVSSGVDTEATVDVPAAYIEPVDRESGESLGVWMTTVGLTPQAVEVGGVEHGLELQFKRTYKPYSVTLEDFQFKRYAGTEVPKDFSSNVVLRDPEQGIELPVRIWMNNPLRYAGDTFYQSSYDPRTETTSVLQVVTYPGWLIPYLSCMIVGLGMTFHFALTLGRFARRRVEEAGRLSKPEQGAVESGPGLLSARAWRQPIVWAPALAAVVAVGYFAGKARPASDNESIERFGSLPIAEGGRIKPLDTLARTTLQSLSSRQEVINFDEAGERLPPVPATEWLLDVLSGRDGWRDHRIFRIENLEVIEQFGLEPRPGSFRYSYADVMADPAAADERFREAFEQRSRFEAAQKAGESQEKPPLVVQRLLRLAGRVRAFEQLAVAFQEPRLGGEGADIRQQLMRAQGTAEMLKQAQAPRCVPPAEPGGEWNTLFGASLVNILGLVTKAPPSDAAIAWSDALTAYAQGDQAALSAKLTDIEAEIEKHQRSLEASPEVLAGLARSERLDASKVRFEHFFNAFSPVYYCAVMYLIAYVLNQAGFLASAGSGWSRALGRSATAVVVVTLLVHTIAVLGRIYISGRPPVTNLYSSAVFIGWAVALSGVLYELVYRSGIGCGRAAEIGFATSVVAYNLSLEGDTFTVLRAVLDTQFWLATHVVCVTFGYAATYLAGFLAMNYLLGVAAPALLGLKGPVNEDNAKQFSRMIYGTLCFALLFSFVGTVLGGLWADDSWGRFWGWDPKENGALIIVLWNALVLHARWGKMIGPVGLATLAVGGNIVTTWSWFGVNELGVGLHAYGDSESSTATWLLVFVLSQLAIMAIGCVAPKRVAG